MRIPLLLLSTFLVVFLLVGTEASAASYKKSLNRWSRSDSVFVVRDLKAEILWSATFLSDEMIFAQAKAFQKAYRVPADEREEFLATLKTKRGSEVLFFVSFYSHDHRFDDLTNPLAKWDLRIESGGEAFRPNRVEKIVRLSPLESLFFPYVSPWSKSYYVWFPSEVLNRPFPWNLSIFGPRAHSTLIWK